MEQMICVADMIMVARRQYLGLIANNQSSRDQESQAVLLTAEIEPEILGV